MQVLEYNYYEGTLQIGVHTPRLNPTPATVFLAGTLHAELCARVRAALREYKAVEGVALGLPSYLPSVGGFPLYGIRKIAPAGALWSVDEDFNLEVTMQRFTLGLAMLPSTFTEADEIALAHERHIEKAVRDCLTANNVPADVVIPGDSKQLGETWLEIMFELGPALEQGDIEVAE